jgi:hypothetical protein
MSQVKYNTETDKFKRYNVAIYDKSVGAAALEKGSKKDIILEILGNTSDFMSNLNISIISFKNTKNLNEIHLNVALYYLVVMSLKDDHIDIEKFDIKDLNEIFNEILKEKDEIENICFIKFGKTYCTKKISSAEMLILCDKLLNFFKYVQLKILKKLNF